MNLNPVQGTAWKGRILAEYWVEDVKYPQLCIKDLEKGVDGWSLVNGSEQSYTVAVEFGQAVCLPYKDKYKLKLQIGKHKIQSGDPKESDQSWCRWDEQKIVEIKDTY